MEHRGQRGFRAQGTEGARLGQAGGHWTRGKTGRVAIQKPPTETFYF